MAKTIVALETRIAHAQTSLIDSQDIHKANNLWRMSAFATKAPGLDCGDQRFFLAFGQAWCSKIRDAATRQRLATDVHAPPTSAPRPCATSTPGIPHSR